MLLKHGLPQGPRSQSSSSHCRRLLSLLAHGARLQLETTLFFCVFGSGETQQLLPRAVFNESGLPQPQFVPAPLWRGNGWLVSFPLHLGWPERDLPNQ